MKHLLKLWDKIGELIPYTILYTKNKNAEVPRWAIEKFRIYTFGGVVVFARKVDTI